MYQIFCYNQLTHHHEISNNFLLQWHDHGTIQLVNQNNPTTNLKLHDAQIDSLSHDGRGIAHINNKIVFLENALPNEEVRFIYTKQHRKFSEGQAIEILKSSPNRVAPSCNHYEICGGCTLQHLSHQQQLLFKTKVLQEQLKHLAGIEIKNLLSPIIGPTLGYRNKARLSVKQLQKNQQTLVGFHEKNGRYVTATKECVILHPTVGKKMALLRELIGKLSIAHKIPQIEVACGDKIIVLVLRHLEKFSAKDLALITEFSNLHQIQFYSQSGGIETITPMTFHETDAQLSYQLPDHQLEIKFSPTAFTQINNYVNPKMVNLALELLAIKPNDQVLDLFCGIGNFTLPIAKRCLKATGVENNNNAIIQAKKNSVYNQIENIEFYSADLTQKFSTATWCRQQYDKILLDPPRTGAQEVCLELKKFGAKRIVYVSCNPATFARDAKLIVEHGYELQNITLVDMYPHTSHMETVATFS